MTVSVRYSKIIVIINFCVIYFKTMAVLNFHYKVYKEDPKLVLGIGDTVSYYVNQFLQYFGLKRYEFPSEEEKLPTVSYLT